MNGPFETPGPTPMALTGRKAWTSLLQILQDCPKDRFGQLGVPLLTSMGQVIATGSSRTTNQKQLTGMQAQRIADVIEADAVRQLSKEQSNNMAPRTVGARFLFNTCFPSQLRYHERRNEIAELVKNRDFSAGVVFVFVFHPCRVAGLQANRNTFLLSYGTLLIGNLSF